MDKDLILEATRAALDEVAAEREGVQRLTEDLLYRLIERDREFKKRLIMALSGVAVLQIALLLAFFVF